MNWTDSVVNPPTPLAEPAPPLADPASVPLLPTGASLTVERVEAPARGSATEEVERATPAPPNWAILLLGLVLGLHLATVVFGILLAVAR